MEVEEHDTDFNLLLLFTKTYFYNSTEGLLFHLYHRTTYEAKSVSELILHYFHSSKTH